MQAFKSEMATALQLEESPFNASLEKVLPGVHKRSQAATAQAGVLSAKLESAEE